MYVEFHRQEMQVPSPLSHKLHFTEQLSDRWEQSSSVIQLLSHMCTRRSPCHFPALHCCPAYCKQCDIARKAGNFGSLRLLTGSVPLEWSHPPKPWVSLWPSNAQSKSTFSVTIRFNSSDQQTLWKHLPCDRHCARPARSQSPAGDRGL